MAGERILLVDADAELRRFLADNVLCPAGYEVLIAADGAEGFTLAHDLRPDLVIAGDRLSRVDGLSMLEALRTEGGALPFILTTAAGSEALAVRALRLGVADYLVKPFRPEALLASVQRVLREHWTRQIVACVPDRLLDANRQLEQRMRALDTLVQIGKQVTAQLDLQTVLNHVVEAAVALAAAEEGSLLLVDRASGELYLYAGTGAFARDGASFRLPIEDSLAGKVLETREPLAISGQELQKLKTGYHFRDLTYVPLLLKERALGVLGVMNCQASAPFAPHTLELLSVLADFAAIAIENAQLYALTEQERDTLDTILRNTEDPIIVVDSDNRVLFCNPAVGPAFGVDLATYQGRPVSEVFAHEDLIELLEKPVRAGRGRRSEIALAGGQRILSAQLTVVPRVGRLIMMQDITQLRELDRQKRDFVTAVSHDLRSPLTAILGYVELLSRAGPLNDHQRHFVDRIASSVKSITGLIADLLELDKLEAGFDEDRELVDMRLVVEHAVETQRHQWEIKQHDLQVTISDGTPPVQGNPLRLRQMATNLLENAVKYTPEGGQIQVSLTAEDSFIVLRVADSGIGIPQKDLPYIFDKFYRAETAVEHYSGTGLGLSIVKRIVDQHDGRIWVESQVDRGSVFTIMLPSADADT